MGVRGSVSKFWTLAILQFHFRLPDISASTQSHGSGGWLIDDHQIQGENRSDSS